MIQPCFGHVCPPRSTYTGPMPDPPGAVYAHILTNPSCAGVIRSELVEPGAAACVFRGMAGPCLLKAWDAQHHTS